jgi:hypothetical protein
LRRRGNCRRYEEQSGDKGAFRESKFFHFVYISS